MSEKEVYPNENQEAAEHTENKQNHQRKPWQKRNQVHPEQDKKDPEKLFMLRYGPNNNFHLWKEAMSKTALKNYGNLGKLITLGKYYELKEPDADTFTCKMTQLELTDWLTRRTSKNITRESMLWQGIIQSYMLLFYSISVMKAWKKASAQISLMQSMMWQILKACGR